MSWLEALFLGALQGITEFLPVSSSGHLVLFQNMFGWDTGDTAQEIFFDGVLHLGTLLAVLFYFGKEARQSLSKVWGCQPSLEQPTAWPATLRDFCYLLILIGIATAPAAVAMLWKNEDIKASFKKPDVVAGNFIILGAVLLLTDRLRPGTTTAAQTRPWQALLIGLAQGCSALFRGLSRSGSTMAAALLVGLERSWAVRFSFMMSAVASLGLGGSGIWKAWKDPARLTWLTPDFLMKTLAATLVSALVGYLTITPLIALVKRCRLWIFALYVWCVALLYFLYPLVKSYFPGSP
jgi:undecaprenyl-diphosphatase